MGRIAALTIPDQRFIRCKPSFTPINILPYEVSMCTDYFVNVAGGAGAYTYVSPATGVVKTAESIGGCLIDGGGHWYKATATTASSYFYTGFYSSQSYPIEVGAAYSASLYVKTSIVSSGTFALNLRYYNGATALGSNSTGDTIQASACSDWTLLKVENVTAPASATSILMYVGIATKFYDTNDWVGVDCIQLEKSTTATDFVPGYGRRHEHQKRVYTFQEYPRPATPNLLKSDQSMLTGSLTIVSGTTDTSGNWVTEITPEGLRLIPGKNILSRHVANIEANVTYFGKEGACATYVRSTDEHYDGASCMSVITTGADGRVYTTTYGLQPGYYTFSYYIKGSLAGGARHFISTYTAGTPVRPNYSSNLGALTSDWTRCSFTFYNPDRQTLSLYPIRQVAAGSLSAYVDCIQLEPGIVATPWEDGLDGTYNSEANYTIVATVPGSSILGFSSIVTSSDTSLLSANAIYTYTKNRLTANESNIETNTTGFTQVTSAILERDTSIYYGGIASLKVTPGGTAIREGVSITLTSTNKFTIGNTYTFSCYVKLTSASNNAVKLAFVRNSGIIIGSESTAVSGTTDWTRVSLTNIPTSSTLTLRAHTSVTQTQPFWIDNIQFEEGSTATDWTTGSTGDNFTISAEALGEVGTEKITLGAFAYAPTTQYTTGNQAYVLNRTYEPSGAQTITQTSQRYYSGNITVSGDERYIVPFIKITNTPVSAVYLKKWQCSKSNVDWNIGTPKAVMTTDRGFDRIHIPYVGTPYASGAEYLMLSTSSFNISSMSNILSGFTVEAWVRTNSLSSCIINKWGSSNQSFRLYIDTLYPKLAFSNNGTTNTILSSVTPVTTGTWIYLVGTYRYLTNGTSIGNLYLNGTKVASSTTLSSLYNSEQPYIVNGDNELPANTLYLGKIAIHDFPMNATEITGVYDYEKGWYGL
jgi:hypothetical protein